MADPDPGAERPMADPDPGAERPEPSRGAAADQAAGARPVTIELDLRTALQVLEEGELEVIGRIVASSNNALLGSVGLDRAGDGRRAASAEGAAPHPRSEVTDGASEATAEGATAAERRAASRIALPCVYKPLRGERPLWDFPDGTLARREVAAFLLSEAGDWSVVPPTVFRDGPFGPGMVQLWLDPDEEVDRVALVVDGDERLRSMALFDAVANNADRKVGHLLPMPDGHIYGVDHGICFHVEPKLRTVLWNWRGERLRDDEVAVLGRLRTELAGPLGRHLGALLDPEEVAATARRVDDLLAVRRFPMPDPDRPAIPWPPY